MAVEDSMEAAMVVGRGGFNDGGDNGETVEVVAVILAWVMTVECWGGKSGGTQNFIFLKILALIYNIYLFSIFFKTIFQKQKKHRFIRSVKIFVAP